MSALVRHWEDFGIITALLALNAVVGFWEEYHADTAIEALKKKLALHGRVKRDAMWRTIPAREIVPGDVARTRGRLWSSRPSGWLIGAVVGTQIAATFIAVYGLFMTALGWPLAMLVWGYALVWSLLADQVKLAAYRVLDPEQPGLLTRRGRATGGR